MKDEFSRQELYDLVWSQPMRTVAASIGISDVALAKHCKKANIPVPNRGYWARKQAGKSTIQIELPPRFPGASDRIGGSARNDYYWGSDWAEKFKAVDVPPVPTFDEEMSSVEERVRRLVGRLQCSRKFEPAHPLITKILSYDEERRKEYAKWRSEYYAPKYDGGIERRRLLIINALFMAAARLGCRPSMKTGRYGQEINSERGFGITVAQSHIDFTLEPVKSKKEGEREQLRLVLGTARDRSASSKSWIDEPDKPLEQQLAEVMVQTLLTAEISYRDSLLRHREWIIERKAAAEAELKRRTEEAERAARELEEKLMRERIGRLLSQAKSLDRANQIRCYVESVRSFVTSTDFPLTDFEGWASWAHRQADLIDPLKNGTIARAILEQTASDSG